MKQFVFRRLMLFIFSFICSFFNDAVSSPGYLALKGKMINEWEGIMSWPISRHCL
jgi:hypothetical protein